MRIDAALRAGTEQLDGISPSARLDAEILLAHCLGKQRSYLYTWPEETLNSEQCDAFNEAIVQRLGLYPVAYIVGYQEFWSLTLKVTPAVLIPRADTERLVEVALEKIAELKQPKILDLGTGSGAIALALATERPDSKVTATDFSLEALDIARENREALKIENIRFIESDWFTNVPIDKYDLIVSNPPYIDPSDNHLKSGIRYEPIEALASESNGLRDLAHIVTIAPKYLNNGCWLILEHGYDQGEAVSSLLRKAAYQRVSCLTDLNGNARVNLGFKSNISN